MRGFITTLVATMATAGTLVTTPSIAWAQGTGRQAAPQQATVRVQNDKKVPVTVFIDRGEFDVRVGVVGPMQTATLKLPSWVVNGGSDVQLFVQPEGGNDLESQDFPVHPGVQLGVLVPSGDRLWSSEPAAAKMTAVIPPNELSATTLTVENERPVSVVMYVDQGDFDVRLGTVAANSTATLTLPQWIVSRRESVEIFAHPVNGQDLESTRLDLRKGEHLGLRVASK